jgi:hypothetical protein
MFKKAEDIKPLPAGMVDAFTAKVSAQGYKMPEVEAVAEEPTVEVEAQPEEVSEATGSRGADKTGPGDGDTKMPKVADVTPEIGMISSKDKAAKSVETAVKAASKSQHEETEGFEIIQDGGKVELEDVVQEATMDEKSCVGEMKKLHASSCSKHEMYKRVSEKYGCSEAKFEELYAQYCSENYEEVQEDNSNDKSDDGEGMDKVQPKAVKKKFGDRKDKDIDNDGDEDESDEYLHKRRKAISKALED